MKTQAQNTKEVMTYLEKSSQNFFESEDGQHWQAIVKLEVLDKYVFVKDGTVNEINMDHYIGEGKTAGKTYLKQKIHPQWNPSNSNWYSSYGHGPAKKIRSVRRNRFRRELVETAIQNYLLAQTAKGSD